MTAPTAREVLFDIVTSKPDWTLPEDKAAVSVDTATAAMEAYASRLVEEARREERERCARVAENFFSPNAGAETVYAEHIAAAIRLPDAPERDGGAA